MKTTFALLILACSVSAMSTHAGSAHITPLLKEADLSNWLAFNAQGLTQYDRVMDLEQGVVLRAESHASASGYRYGESVDLDAYPFLQWQWTVERFPHFMRVSEQGLEQPVTQFDEASLKGDDYAVRLTVGRNALFGESKALHYVWSSQGQAGGQWSLDKHNVVFAVSGQETSTLRWQTVKRDISQDWKKAFNEDIDNVDYISIMTDTDDIRGQAIGYYGDIELVGR